MRVRPIVKVVVLSLLWVLTINEQSLIGFSSVQAANATKDALTLGIFPRRNTNVTVKLFNPLAEHLTKQLGKRVIIKTSRNFSTFWKEILNGRYDIVHYNQYHYITSRDKIGYKVIAKNEEFGEDTIAGSILVRKDSGIKKLSDLKGKTISFGGGSKAMQSYILPLFFLREAGLTEQDYGSIFAKNPPNAIMSVYFRQADAAGSGDKVLDLPMVTEIIHKDELRFLVRGEQLPHLPWAVSPKIGRTMRLKIQDTLTSLAKTPQGQRVLNHAKLTGINRATDAEYDKHREIIKSVFSRKN